MRGELPQCRQRSNFQSVRFRSTQIAHGRKDSATLARDFFIGRAGNALLVFGGAAGGGNEVGMGVDQARQDHAPAQIQFFRAACIGKARYPDSCPYREDVAVAHEHGAVAHEAGISHGRTAPRDAAAKCKKFFATRDQKVSSHSAAIIAQLGSFNYSLNISDNESLF